ncbi:MAG: hypothetical protein AAF934_09345 [Bacteroidota bacterium]
MTTNNYDIFYPILQESFSELVRIFGLEGAVRIIDSLSKNVGNLRRKVYQTKLVKKHIIDTTIFVFELDEKDFYHMEIRKCREARMVCYHLLYKYVADSHAEIAKIFDKKRGSVLYFIHKCNDILSVPGSHRTFIEKYKQVESSAAHLIAGLNQYNALYFQTICS